MPPSEDAGVPRSGFLSRSVGHGPTEAALSRFGEEPWLLGHKNVMSVGV